jgi:hypothetical protein
MTTHQHETSNTSDFVIRTILATRDRKYVHLVDFLGVLKAHPLFFAGKGGDEGRIREVILGHSQGVFMDRLTYRMSFF